MDRHTPVKILPWPNFVAAGKDEKNVFLYSVALLEIRNKAEAERERKRREEVGESTEGIEPGSVDWLYGTKNHEEIKEDSNKADPVVASNMWEDKDSDIVRGKVCATEKIHGINKEPLSQARISLRILFKKWEVEVCQGLSIIMTNYLRIFVYLKVEDITHAKAGQGMKPDETIFSTVPQSRKHLIAEISGMFDQCTIHDCTFSWRSTCINIRCNNKAFP